MTTSHVLRADATRVAPAAAAAAFFLLLVLAPVQSAIWNGAGSPVVVRMIAGTVAPSLVAGQGAAALPQPPDLYFTWGRCFVAVYAGMLLALAVRPLRARLWLWAALSVLLAVAAGADVLAYWASRTAGPGLRAIAFWRIEVPALVAALVVASAYGIATRRDGRVPRVVAWTFALVVPAALVSTAAVRYMPHGPLLPLAFAVLVHAWRRA